MPQDYGCITCPRQYFLQRPRQNGISWAPLSVGLDGRPSPSATVRTWPPTPDYSGMADFHNPPVFTFLRRGGPCLQAWGKRRPLSVVHCLCAQGTPLRRSERLSQHCTLRTEHAAGSWREALPGYNVQRQQTGALLCCASMHPMMHTRQSFGAAGLLSCSQTRQLCRSGLAASPWLSPWGS